MEGYYFKSINFNKYLFFKINITLLINKFVKLGDRFQIDFFTEIGSGSQWYG